MAGLDWNDAPLTVSWATILLDNGDFQYYWYTSDGWFDGYLNPGIYQLSITEWTEQDEGHYSYSNEIAVSEGQRDLSGVIMLNLSEIPISEFPTSIVVIVLCFPLICGLWAIRTLKVRRHI